VPLQGLEPKSRDIRASDMTTVGQKPVDILRLVTDSFANVIKQQKDQKTKTTANQCLPVPVTARSAASILPRLRVRITPEA